jgi:hypothetical protein
MKRAALCITILVSTACAALAPAVEHAAHANAPLGRRAWSSLPAGKLRNEMPKNAPTAIPNNAAIEGMLVTLEQGGAGVFVQGQNGDRQPTDLCFDQLSPAEGTPEPSWSQPNAQASLQNTPRIHPLRVERLVTSKEGTFLETRFVWVDSETTGARVVATERMGFAELARVDGPKPVVVYGARDAGDGLQVIVAGEGAASASAMTLGGEAANSCPFTRVRVTARKGEADAANFTVEIPVPAVGDAGEEVESDRFRNLRVHAGVSWTSRDPAPIFTLSMNWEGSTRRAWGD